VEVDSLQSNWWVVYRDGQRLGFASNEVLESEPIPPIEIADWNWYSDPDFGTDGAIIWTVQVRNNTSDYVEQVRVEFASHDKAGRIITSDFTFVSGIPPGQSRSSKSYATYFGTEHSARVAVGDFR
jgi:hypothetical protein